MAATTVGNMIVARYSDGRLLKGATTDFSPERPEFHLLPMGARPGETVVVRVRDLKAVFFVRSFDSDGFHEHIDTDEVTGPGRRVEVTFPDGEVLLGSTLGYNKDKAGFFLTPAENSGNNERVFIPHHAPSRVHCP